MVFPSTHQKYVIGKIRTCTENEHERWLISADEAKMLHTLAKMFKKYYYWVIKGVYFFFRTCLEKSDWTAQFSAISFRTEKKVFLQEEKLYSVHQKKQEHDGASSVRREWGDSNVILHLYRFTGKREKQITI